jgi:chlorite dismutase
MSKKEFVPMKVYLSVEAYELDKRDAEAKLKHISNGLEWCSNHIDIDKMDRKEFLFDMEKTFSAEVLKQHGDIVKKEIAVDKLYFLLDINVTELKQIQGQVDNLNVKVGIKDNEYFSIVNEEDYWIMTKDEEQNDKLIKANNLIQAIDMVSKYRKVYPADICRGTSGFLNYDFRRQKYFLNLT